MGKMDSELVAIQRIRTVLASQKLNRDQSLRVLNYVTEGIYRAQQGPISTGGAWAGDAAPQQAVQTNSDPMAHARIEPPSYVRA